MAMSNRERYMVIQQLMQKYPYPEKFYDRLYDDQLLAMLYKQPSTNKREKAKKSLIHKEEDMIAEPKRKVVDGVTYILTDGGYWEEEQD